MFDETIDHLRDLLPNTNLICVDLNGHGKTTTGRNTFTLWDQANDVVTLMVCLPCTMTSEIISALLHDTKFISNSHLYANTGQYRTGSKSRKQSLISMGAGIALRIALSHCSHVTALILMGSTSDASIPEAIAAISKVRDIWVSTSSPSEEIIDIAIRAWGGDPDLNGPCAQRIKRYWVARHSGADNVDPILQSVDQGECLLPKLHDITVPVLLIHGGDDETWKLEEALRIQDAIGKAKAKTHIVKDSGHLVVHMRDSEDISQVIAEFVKRDVPKHF